MPATTLADRMLETHPRDLDLDRDLLARCIAACSDCATACTLCADDCLSEPTAGELVKCIRLNLDCADVCAATGRVLGRQTAYDANVTRAILEACVASCRACADECARHAEGGMEHCRVCADQCASCEAACRELLAGIA